MKNRFERPIVKERLKAECNPEDLEFARRCLEPERFKFLTNNTPNLTPTEQLDKSNTIEKIRLIQEAITPDYSSLILETSERELYNAINNLMFTIIRAGDIQLQKNKTAGK